MGRWLRWAAVGVLALGLAGGAASGLAEDLRPVRPMDPPEPLALAEAKPTPPTPAAAVALVWTNPAEVRVNRPAAYTLAVTNTGDMPVYQVVVQVRVPAGVTASDAQPPAKAVGGVLLWELGTLAAGESKPLAMSFASPAKGTLTADAWVTCTGTAATIVQVREPKLEAYIYAPATVEIGQSIPVKYGVRNTGDTRLDNVVQSLSPTHSGPKVFRTFGGFRNTPHGGTVRSVEPGEARTNEENEPTTRAGVVTFDYTVTAADGLTAKATAKVKVLAPKLVVTVEGPAEVGVGRAGTYRVKVENTGDAPARGVRPTLAPAPALIRIDGDLPAEFDLKPGEKREFAMIGDLTTPGEVVTKVSAQAANAAVTTAECRTVVKGVPGIRMEVVDTADPLKVGDETTYEVKVTNTGTAADRNLVLACDLPPGMTLVKADGPVPYLERLGVDANRPGPDKNVHAVTFEPVRELGPKTEAVFKVTVKVGQAGAAKFTARLASDHLTTPVVKEESTTVYGE